MAITTTESLKGGRGEQCDTCKQRAPVVRVTGAGQKICPACEPNREQVVTVAPKDEPADVAS